jgi:hypothetical protein
MDRPFQRRIRELEINVNVIRASTPKAVMFNVFARLNQGGLPLSAQEIRNAIFPGSWRNHIRDMAQSNEFLEATSNRIPIDRQQDMEMVLRFVALWSLDRPFLRPTNQVLDKFLNDTVESRLVNWSDGKWKQANNAFQRGLEASLQVFGKHAFRKSYGPLARSPINKGLFEAELITLSELKESEVEKLVKRRSTVSKLFGELMLKQGRFATSLRSGTGHAESSNARIEELRKLLREALNA